MASFDENWLYSNWFFFKKNVFGQEREPGDDLSDKIFIISIIAMALSTKNSKTLLRIFWGPIKSTHNLFHIILPANLAENLQFTYVYVMF